MQRTICTLALAVSLATLPQSTHAHSGGTDKYGCHNSSGGRHCHGDGGGGGGIDTSGDTVIWATLGIAAGVGLIVLLVNMGSADLGQGDATATGDADAWISDDMTSGVIVRW